ncbi:hypothetical protein [Atlantibacter sp.]|uniref:hypothetical protein n=1 Tax=Atlantibacter sp. TaxID=1903473 RepID=UPI002899D693|nr:hypothetical protein [Atlantibacter sp.]
MPSVPASHARLGDGDGVQLPPLFFQVISLKTTLSLKASEKMKTTKVILKKTNASMPSVPASHARLGDGDGVQFPPLFFQVISIKTTLSLKASEKMKTTKVIPKKTNSRLSSLGLALTPPRRN